MTHFWRQVRTGWTILRKPLVVRTRPLHFQLEPVIGCNLRCRMCQVPGYPPERYAQMTLPQFQHIFDQIQPIKVALSGAGEPFMNPDLLPMVRYARAHGASVLTTTNFTLCTKKLEEIVRSGLDLIKISLDATAAETYQKIRGLDRFDLIVRDLEELQAVKKRLNSATPYVRLQFVLQSDNLGEIESMMELAHRVRANSVYFQPLETLLIQERKQDLARGVEFDLLRERLEAARRKGKALGIGTNAAVLLGNLGYYYRKYEPGIPAQPPSRVCLLPWFSLYIAVTGDVRPCCSFAEPGTVSIGNLLEQPFEEIWNGEAYQRLRREALERKLCYPVCRNCIPNRLRDFLSLSAVLPGFFKSGVD